MTFKKRSALPLFNLAYTFHTLQTVPLSSKRVKHSTLPLLGGRLMNRQPQSPGVWPYCSASQWLGSIAVSIKASCMPCIHCARLSETDWLLFTRKLTSLHRWWGLIPHAELSARDAFQWKEKMKCCFTSSSDYRHGFITVSASLCTLVRY